LRVKTNPAKHGSAASPPVGKKVSNGT